MPLDPVVWPGSVYAWLCTSATVEGLARGRACRAAHQIGEPARPCQRVSAKDPCTDGQRLGAGSRPVCCFGPMICSPSELRPV
jgi:hypothetical protein